MGPVQVIPTIRTALRVHRVLHLVHQVVLQVLLQAVPQIPPMTRMQAEWLKKFEKEEKRKRLWPRHWLKKRHQGKVRKKWRNLLWGPLKISRSEKGALLEPNHHLHLLKIKSTGQVQGIKRGMIKRRKAIEEGRSPLGKNPLTSPGKGTPREPRIPPPKKGILNLREVNLALLPRG